MRNPLVRYGGLALAAAGIMIVALASLASVLVEGWSQRDIELRTGLVFRSIRDQVTAGIAAKPGFDLIPFFERLAQDERILALGFCPEQGPLQFATKLLPKTVTCETVKRGKTDTFTIVSEAGRRIHVSAFPITAGTVTGHLMLLHDLAYIDERAKEARFFSVLALVGVAAGFGLLATAMVLGLMRAWARSIRSAIVDAQLGDMVSGQPQGDSRISREVHVALSEMRLERRFATGIHVEWSPKTLQRVLVEELPGTQVLVVSNREPYIHNRSNGAVALQIPASGLVAALEPVMRACGGTWIAHGSGSADREMVDTDDRIRVPPAGPAYTLRRVWLTDEEQDGYYYGFANEGLWPLCHIAFVRPMFREGDWAQYQAVNEHFANVVAREASCNDPIVLVQDYHFALLPRMIRERLPKSTIITFWHIPWPNAETFSICPWRREIIDGMLGSTILGFHTQFHCNNFIDATDRFMESRIDREHASVTFGGHETLIRPYPISIEWPPEALANQASVPECREAIKQRFLCRPMRDRRRYRAPTTPRAFSTHPRGRRPAESPSRMERQARLYPGSGTDAQQAGRLQRTAGRCRATRQEINTRHGTNDFSHPTRRPPPRAGRGLRIVPCRRHVYRLKPARRHEPCCQGVRRRARRRAGRADPVELRRRLPRAQRGADRQSLRHPRYCRGARPGAPHASRRAG
jgi:trehalose 6-phosphate synthase